MGKGIKKTAIRHFRITDSNCNYLFKQMYVCIDFWNDYRNVVCMHSYIKALRLYFDLNREFNKYNQFRN